ncbi:Hypothetical predicted protein [Octopus vulgaris]|uniref:Uncharacterized protein n=1 Tax=Octopus vulgaris TaxID=6645 RepID=A0AA36AT31_OCTVU|nr:Hypothetical predicted protein [Octopus vulgaris]
MQAVITKIVVVMVLAVIVDVMVMVAAAMIIVFVSVLVIYDRDAELCDDNDHNSDCFASTDRVDGECYRGGCRSDSCDNDNATDNTEIVIVLVIVKVIFGRSGCIAGFSCEDRIDINNEAVIFRGTN